MLPVETALTPHRREFLAEKGRLLYGKYCGTQGEGICAESFAIYHLQLGEVPVVQDFLVYLRHRLALLEQNDPAQRLPMTRRLVERIEDHLADADEF